MKTLPSIVLFVCFAIFAVSCKGDDFACGDPPLPRKELIDIYMKEMQGRQDIDIEKLKKEKDSNFTVLEERCAYTITHDRFVSSGKQRSIKINRKGKIIYTYSAESSLSNGGKNRVCSDPPLTGDQLVNIYVTGSLKRNDASVEKKIEEGWSYTIWEDGCDYGMGSRSPQIEGDGPVKKINRKGEIIFFLPGL
jgi:hypothetical protein